MFLLPTVAPSAQDNVHGDESQWWDHESAWRDADWSCKGAEMSRWGPGYYQNYGQGLPPW